MSVPDAWRNQHTTLDAKRARNRAMKLCERCGIAITGRGGKRFCLACYDARLMQNIAANRHKYRQKKQP